MLRVRHLVCMVCALHIADSAAYLYNGYSNDVPAEPYDRLYTSYFMNLPSMLPCTMTGDVFLSDANGVPDRDDGIAGCAPANGNVHGMLFPISPSDATQLTAEFCTGSATWSQLSRSIPAQQGPISIVLASLTPDAYLYNLSCMLQIARQVGQTVEGSWAQALFFDNHTDFGDLGAPSPLSKFSPYPQPYLWDASATNEMWRSHNFSAVFFPPGSADWELVSKRAYYNLGRLLGSTSVGAYRAFREAPSPLYPRQVSETQLTMWMNQYPAAGTSVRAAGTRLSCLTQTDPFPTCLPIGGQSLWTTTAPSAPSLTFPLPTGFVRPRANSGHNIAVLVSSTSTAFIHDDVPAASTASSIVAALAVLDALALKLDSVFRNTTSPAAPQVFFFFLVGEDYGLAGSGRFIKDINQFNCTRFPQQSTTNLKCMFPIRRSTNFSGVDLSAFEHFIQLDQIGVSNGLYQQVDEGLWQTPGPQRSISQLFEGEGIFRSPVGQIAPGPLFSFYADSDSSRRPTQSFTTISGYRHTLGSRFQTPNDVADFVDVDVIQQAAQATLNVIAGLLALPKNTFQANASTISTLWECFGVDTGCDFFRLGYGLPSTPGTPPGYYPSVFQNYQQISLTQQFIRYYVRDRFRSSVPVNETCPCLHPEYQYCFNGMCYNDYAFFHPAFSPALVEVDNTAPLYWTQDLSYAGPSEIWVESSWGSDLGARLTTVDSTTHGGAIFASGVLAMLLTAGIIVLLHSVVGQKLKNG